MSNIWYLSPSNQGSNLGINGYGSERDQMYQLIYEITPHLDRAGVSFHVPEKSMTLGSRCRESNEMGAKFHFALHSNAGGKGKAWGPVALYYSDIGKELGQKMVDALLALGQQTNRSYHLKEQRTLYELRCTDAPAMLLEVDFHDSDVGVEFITQRRGEIAEAIARVIIEADGKEFVPVTKGEYIHEAVRLGLFPADTDWNSPLTQGKAAQLALKLKEIMERG